MFKSSLSVLAVAAILLLPAFSVAETKVEVKIADKDLQEILEPYQAVVKAHAKKPADEKAIKTATESFEKKLEPITKELKKQLKDIPAKSHLAFALKKDTKADKFNLAFFVREKEDSEQTLLFVFLLGDIKDGEIRDANVYLLKPE